VVVTEVQQGSPADDMGLQKGDIIVSIDGKQIGDVNTLKSLVSTRTQGWQIVINRDGHIIQSYVSG
jgi:S1-C subfamily serine protease